MVVDVEYDELANVVRCVMQAVLTQREFEVEWRELKSAEEWRVGWK